MKFAFLRSKLDSAVVALMALSLFGFLGNVMLSYNWGTVFIVNAFALVYSGTLGRVGQGGVVALGYFVLFLFSYMTLNRQKPFTANLLETLRVAFLIIVLYEVGVCLFVPSWFNGWVIQAFSGTVLGLVTNADLLLISLFAVVALSVYARMKFDR